MGFGKATDCHVPGGGSPATALTPTDELGKALLGVDLAWRAAACVRSER